MELSQGEFVSVFGPNGCGKSTLLHLIAGIVEPDAGEIQFSPDGGSPRSVGIVFQNYENSLLPWRTCLGNVALPLEAEGQLSRRKRTERALSVIRDLELKLPLDHYPYQMSGGQKQLTCIARAMVRRPSLLLLDEPFASLDYQTRIGMQETIQDIWGRTRVTTIFISHEVDEAIYLADRFLLLTSRPARAAGWFKVPLPRPRQFEMLSSGAFVALRAQILDKFMSELRQ
jgi:NitT/TauT family transport system ATP-binding protein